MTSAFTIERENAFSHAAGIPEQTDDVVVKPILLSLLRYTMDRDREIPVTPYLHSLRQL